MGWTSAWGLTHTQRSPPHTRSHAQRRETDAASRLPLDNFKLGFDENNRESRKGKTQVRCFALGKQTNKQAAFECLATKYPKRKRYFFIEGKRTEAKAQPGAKNTARGGEVHRDQRHWSDFSHNGTNEFLITLTVLFVVERKTGCSSVAPLSRKTRVKVWRVELCH